MRQPGDIAMPAQQRAAWERMWREWLLAPFDDESTPDTEQKDALAPTDLPAGGTRAGQEEPDRDAA